VRDTPDALERRAAQQEAAALREAERAAKLKRARVLLSEGFSAEAVSRRLGVSLRAVRRLPCAARQE